MTITRILILIGAQVFIPALGCAQTASLPEPPQVRGKNHVVSLTLHAVNENGRDTFAFNGGTVAPVIRASPGDVLRITYINDLPTKPPESCAITPCMDMTNLHFHGLAVSPDAPQDDVLTMMAMPGKSLRYTVQIPKDHSPGLYWYHTHEGIESYFPALAGLPERILVVRGRAVANDARSTDLKQRVELRSDVCGGEPETPEEVMTVNGSVRPQIKIAPGERQFWRLVNASADRYLDFQLEGQTFEIVAMDGMPIACHRSSSGHAQASGLTLRRYRARWRSESGDDTG